MKSNRQSNIELLRIILMFFIVCFHFTFHPFHLYDLAETPSDSRFAILIFTIPFVFMSVNCFILVSGFFLIKCTAKNLFRFYFQCAFYFTIIYLLVSCIEGSFSYKIFAYKFLPFSHDEGLWFIQSYFILFLLAPLLNMGIKHLGCKEYFHLLITMTVAVVYMGYFNVFAGHIFNEQMSSVLLFMYLYLIGGFIKLNWDSIKKTRNIRYISLISYIVFSLIVSILLLKMHSTKAGYPFYSILRYDNPLLILSATAFFIFFLTLDFRSKAINWLASSSFAIYLIHENNNIRNYFYPYVLNIYTNINSTLVFFLLFVVYALFVCLVCILIDKIRIILTKPIEKIVFSIIDRLTNKPNIKL